MRGDAVSGAELTHFEECACHALAHAHGAIQLLATRLGEKGILNASEVATLFRLTEHDLRNIQAMEDRPDAAHATDTGDSDFHAVIVADHHPTFGSPEQGDTVIPFSRPGR